MADEHRGEDYAPDDLADHYDVVEVIDDEAPTGRRVRVPPAGTFSYIGDGQPERTIPVEILPVIVRPTEPEAPAPIPDAEQEAVIATLRREPFVDVSGTAGVGKTFIARVLAEREQSRMVLAATTGIAAVNLGDATTINSLIGYYDTASLRELYISGRLAMILKKYKHAGLRKILLDEKSMLDAHQLTCLVRAIDEVNTGKVLADVGYDDEESEEAAKANDPTDPLGLILVGDFGQLPPVKAPFAFESDEWRRFADHRVKLTKIRRQADLPFIEALHAVRAGNIKVATDFFTEDRFVPHTDDTFAGTTIFARNEEVDRYNQLRLDAEKGKSVYFKKTVEGKEASEWKKIPNTLHLKIGARVMVLANRRRLPEDGGGIMYANGDTGVVRDVVEQFGVQQVLVELRRTGKVVPVVSVVRELLEPLEPGRAKELRQLGQADKIRSKKYEVVGTCMYMPLRLAYGTTVHKSQGLTLDDVQVNLRDRFFGMPSMLFVALSRCKTPQGLRIVGNQSTFVSRIAVDPVIQEWL